MANGVRRRLCSLKDELANIEPWPWSNIEAWPANRTLVSGRPPTAAVAQMRFLMAG